MTTEKALRERKKAAFLRIIANALLLLAVYVYGGVSFILFVAPAKPIKAMILFAVSSLVWAIALRTLFYVRKRGGNRG